jgi:hypothetical protein
MLQQFQRLAPSGKEVGRTAPHEWAAVSRGFSLQFAGS